MNFLLDTNACIALINGRQLTIRTRFQEEIHRRAEIFVSSITNFELWYGIHKSSREKFNAEKLRSFLAGPIKLLSFDEPDAQAAGAIRATLESSGKPIGAYDLLIAGQAVQRQLILVTANVSEFARVRGLSWQDWAN